MTTVKAWQMTSDEFSNTTYAKKLLQPGKSSIYSGLGNPSRSARRMHYNHMVDSYHRLDVQEAIARGENIPEKVRLEYPDLFRSIP